MANQPYTPYDGPRVAGFTGDQNSAMDMTRGLATGPSAVNGANTYVNNVMSGKAGVNQYMGQTASVGQNKYAGANPYLNQMINTSQKEIANAYTDTVMPGQLAQFNAGGAFGGTAHQSAMANSNRELAGALGDVSSQMRGQDYYTQQQLAESALNRSLGAQ